MLTNAFFSWKCLFKAMLNYVFFGNLLFFKIHVNFFTACDDSLCSNVILKWMLWVRGLVQISQFWGISFLLISSLLIGISEKAMAPHSSTLAWKIPWMEEPGRLQSVGSQRVGRDWTTSLSLFTSMHWRRKWQPTPVFLPGKIPGMVSHRVGHDWSDLAVTIGI